MQTTHLADSRGLEPELATQFIVERAPESNGPWLVRDPQQGSRCWLQILPEEAAAAGSPFQVLLTKLHGPSFAALRKSAGSGVNSVLLDWQGESGLPDNPSATVACSLALQLLDAVYLLHSLPEPAAFRGLQRSQLMATLPLGRLRLVDYSGLQPAASEAELAQARSETATILRDLVPGLAVEATDVLAAWENSAAEAYPQLRGALQRQALAALAADF